MGASIECSSEAYGFLLVPIIGVRARFVRKLLQLPEALVVARGVEAFYVVAFW
jgi:hypothetical protein